MLSSALDVDIAYLSLSVNSVPLLLFAITLLYQKKKFSL